MIEKYGGNLNASDLNSTYGKLVRDIEKNSTILEFGCYTGKTGQMLSEIHNSELIGIDYDARALDQAKSKDIYTDLIQMDLNHFDRTKMNVHSDAKFDYILLCDVIEHLFDPINLLKKIRTMLKEDGYFIISVPNISHGGLQLKLLQNRFDYTESGLLDFTHIRFFTIHNFLEILNKAGLKIHLFDRVFASIDDKGQNVDLLDFPKKIIDYVKSNSESFTYQYYAKCSLVNDQAGLYKENAEAVFSSYKVPNELHPANSLSRMFRKTKRFIKKVWRH